MVEVTFFACDISDTVDTWAFALHFIVFCIYVHGQQA
jgi:hypothetical protein